VCNLDLFREKEEFRGNLIKPTISMLLHNVGKDSKNSCGGVVSYTMRKGHFIYEKMKPKKRNKLVQRI
jgi:hypothetical protein